MSIQPKLHPEEIFKVNHFNIVLVLQNLLFGESNDVPSIISFVFLKFTIDKPTLTNHAKSSNLEVTIIFYIKISKVDAFKFIKKYI